MMREIFWKFWPPNWERYFLRDVEFYFPGRGDGQRGTEITFSKEVDSGVPFHPTRIIIGYSQVWWFVHLECEEPYEPIYFEFFRTPFSFCPSPRTIMLRLCQEILVPKYSSDLRKLNSQTRSEEVTLAKCRQYASLLV